ncbi:MAG: glycosyltransferase family 2 protein [Candidatus Nanohaloarchaeota archaeon QJJ-9]|nr:glycosyltransferase family 2 protein [Candidatus Nanohaloarchaeota archaeon QJJ-9]
MLGLVYYALIAPIGLVILLEIYLLVRHLRISGDEVEIEEKMEEDLSVVVPAHNEEGNIRECARQLLCQEYIDLEIIFVDDNSTDNSYSICKDLSDKYSNIRVIKRDDGYNSIARTVRAGIREAQRDYFCSITCDVRLDSKALAKCFSYLKEKDADVVSCPISPVQTQDSRILQILSNAKIYRQKFLQKARDCDFAPLIPGAFYILRKELIEDKLRDDSFVEDLSLTYDLYQKDSKIAIYPESLVWEEEKKDLLSYIHQFTRWSIGNMGLAGKWVRTVREIDGLKRSLGVFSLPYLLYFPAILLFLTLLLTFLDPSMFVWPLLSLWATLLFVFMYTTDFRKPFTIFIFSFIFPLAKVMGVSKGVFLFIKNGRFFKTSDLY